MGKASHLLNANLARANLTFFKNARNQSVFGLTQIAKNKGTIEANQAEIQKCQTSINTNKKVEAESLRVYNDMESLLSELHSAKSSADDSAFAGIGAKWCKYSFTSIASQDIETGHATKGKTTAYAADLASTGAKKIKDNTLATAGADDAIKDATQVLVTVKQDLISIHNANFGLKSYMEAYEGAIAFLEDMNIHLSKTDILHEKEKEQSAHVDAQLDMLSRTSKAQNEQLQTQMILQSMSH